MIIIKCESDKDDIINVDRAAIIKIDDEAHVSEVLYGIVKAMLFEGYSIISISNIIKELANSIDKNYDIEAALEDMIYN